MPAAEAENLSAAAYSMVDELGRIEEWYRTNKWKIDRRETLKKQLIASLGESARPEVEYEVVGALYAALISPRENQRKITSMERVKRALGASEFVKAVTMTLKALDERMCKSQQRELGLTTEARTGPREIRITRLEPAQNPGPEPLIPAA